MAVHENGYVSRADLKTELGISDTTDDNRIDRIIRDVSRWIDRYTGRRFYPRTATRYYSARHADTLAIDDLLSVTTLQTDSSGDRGYGTTWTSTQYDLMPFNAADESPPEPYTRIDITPTSSNSFPAGVANGVKISGTWGYYNVTVASGATLSAAMDSTQTSAVVSDGTVFDLGDMALVGSEQVHITAVSGSTLTVARARNGTSGAAHSSGAAINLYEFPIVREAAMIQASRIEKRGDTPFGVLGTPEVGMGNVLPSVDQDVKLLLIPLQRQDAV